MEPETRPDRLRHPHIRMDVNLNTAGKPQDAAVPGATYVYVCQFSTGLFNAHSMHTLPSR